MKTIIHVNQHKIKSNAKNNDNQPVLTCKTYKSNVYGHSAEILDAEGIPVASVIYRPNKPLSCGAKVWIETQNNVRVSTDLTGKTVSEKKIKKPDTIDFKWTDELVEEFARVSQAGSYGDYDGCVKLEQKLERFKEIKLFELHEELSQICDIDEK